MTSSQRTEAVAARIMNVTWDYGYDRVRSRIRLLREYERRAALCVTGHDVQRWPFFDVAAVLDGTVRADPALVESVRARLDGKSGTTRIAIDTCLWALHWSELVSVRAAEFTGVADPFEALMTFYERGGVFDFDDMGRVQVDMAILSRSTPAKAAEREPLASLELAFLDGIDRAEAEERAAQQQASGPPPSFSNADGRLRVRFSGWMDERRLAGLTAALGMTRRGRLGDREDAEFGSRVLADGRAELTLWRRDEESWSVTLDYKPDVAGLVSDVVGSVDRAVAAAGLAVVSVKDLPPQGGTA